MRTTRAAPRNTGPRRMLPSWSRVSALELFDSFAERVQLRRRWSLPFRDAQCFAGTAQVSRLRSRTSEPEGRGGHAWVLRQRRFEIDDRLRPTLKLGAHHAAPKQRACRTRIDPPG